MEKKDPDRIWDRALIFIGAVGILLTGVYMVLSDVVGSGTHWLTQQYTASGGELLILLGVIALVIFYLSINPYTKLTLWFKRFRRKFKDLNQWPEKK